MLLQIIKSWLTIIECITIRFEFFGFLPSIRTWVFKQDRIKPIIVGPVLFLHSSLLFVSKHIFLTIENPLKFSLNRKKQQASLSKE